MTDLYDRLTAHAGEPDLYDRLVAYTSAPDVYDPPSLDQLRQLAALYLVAKVEVAPALRKLMLELPYTEETDDLYDTLDACAEDLERLTT